MRTLIDPALCAVGNIERQHQIVTNAYNDNVINDQRRTGNFTAQLYMPQWLALQGLESQQFACGARYDHELAIGSDAAGEPLCCTDAPDFASGLEARQGAVSRCGEDRNTSGGRTQYTAGVTLLRASFANLNEVLPKQAPDKVGKGDGFGAVDSDHREQAPSNAY